MCDNIEKLFDDKTELFEWEQNKIRVLAARTFRSEPVRENEPSSGKGQPA